MSKVLVYPPGSVLTLTQGEYSDFCVAGQLVTLKECDLRRLGRKFVAEKGDRWEASPTYFPAWLVVNGYCMPLECSEVHIGNYGGLQIGD